MFAQLGKFILKNHGFVYLKQLNFMVYKLYFDKAASVF